MYFDFSPIRHMGNKRYPVSLRIGSAAAFGTNGLGSNDFVVHHHFDLQC
ncbi:hypothetical protein SDC9_164846 [bioreactor metagenome]|uniref:Uncharacterized protein n=1 Tax=bioreactor metagenome TaxID=1076179 RepID=A0A645FV11_9ZZZZ